MIQRIWGRIRLFLLLCGIWGALFFNIANVKSYAWFFPTLDFYFLYWIGHIYMLYLLIREFLRKGKRFAKDKKKRFDLTAIEVILLFYLMCLMFIIMRLSAQVSESYSPLLGVYFAVNKEEYSVLVIQADTVSFIFILICFMICCMPSKKLSSIIQRNSLHTVLKFMWPYHKKDIDDIPEFQKNKKDIVEAFIPNRKYRKYLGGSSFVKSCYLSVSLYKVMFWSPFLIVNVMLKLMFGKAFMLKMVGDYEQAGLSEIKNSRVRSFFDRISLYVLLIFTILYITFVVNSIYVNHFNSIEGIGLIIGVSFSIAVMIWAGCDNLIETRKIHEQEIIDLSKKNKNWMLLYAHQLINTGKTIFDDVSLLREKDEPELRIDDLQANTQLLLDDGEKCLNYAQALSRQSVIETIDLINVCKIILAEIEDDRKTAAFCIEDDILFEYSGDDTLFLVKTDENILQKILYELIANAVSYRIPSTAVIITIEKKGSAIQMIIENAVTLKDAEKMQEYLHKIDAFWNWQNVSSAGDIRLGLVFTKGYAEMVDIEINYDVKNKLTFSADLEIPIA